MWGVRIKKKPSQRLGFHLAWLVVLEYGKLIPVDQEIGKSPDKPTAYQPETASTGGGTCRFGMGRPANNRRVGLAIQRAQRVDHATRALSVAMPVSAYILR